MNCIILAAGRNTRLDTGIPKSLVTINEQSLLARHLRIFTSLGVKKFCIVSGFRSERINAVVPKLIEEFKCEISVLHNERFDLENGYSVFRAKEWIDQQPSSEFLLTMGDHVFQRSFVSDFLKSERNEDSDLWLAVDKPGKSNDHIDIEDVTKVLIDEEDFSISQISKGLDEYNYYDTGLFCMKSSIFSVFSESFDNSRFTISDTISQLIQRKRAYGIPVIGHTWNDIDNVDDLENTKRLVEEGKL